MLHCSIQLAKYCDQLLRKGAKGSGESELEDQLDDAVGLIFSTLTLPSNLFR